jgi:hypothetical protein
MRVISSGCEQRSTEASSEVATLVGERSGYEQRSTETSSEVATLIGIVSAQTRASRGHGPVCYAVSHIELKLMYKKSLAILSRQGFIVLHCRQIT